MADIETTGLTATLRDADDDPAFDSSRDATSCEVTEQDPGAGETLANGEEVTVTVSCAQVDWENREGSAWETFDLAYSSGFDDGCDALFNQSPDGSLYEDDYEYTAIDCQNENPGDGDQASDVPPEVPDDPEAAGANAGQLDGCRALFDNHGVSSLNYGPDSWTDSDCPIGGTATLAPARKSSKQSSVKRTGDSCEANQSDGTDVSIEVVAGRVACSGAQALWDEYLRRAPNEGQGSGAALELEGWACVAAPITEAPRLGGCSANDESGTFSVVNNS